MTATTVWQDEFRDADARLTEALTQRALENGRARLARHREEIERRRKPRFTSTLEIPGLRGLGRRMA